LGTKSYFCFFIFVTFVAISTQKKMDIVGKLWSFCHKLRHDGVDSSDYIEQLTYLLFLKMADEKKIVVPEGYDWQSLLSKKNEELAEHLERVFYHLGREKRFLRLFFLEPFSRIENAVILKEIIHQINTTTWIKFDKDKLFTKLEEVIGEDFKKRVKLRVGRFIEKFEIIQNISSPSEGTKKLEELTLINFEKLPKKIKKEEILERGEYPIISQSHQEIIGYTNDASRLFENLLPVIVFGDHTRVFKYVDYPFAIYGYGVRIIIPNTEIVLSKYLFYALKAAYIPNLGYSRHFSEVKKLHIFIPSLTEQEKIVKKLDDSFAELKKQEEEIESKKNKIQKRKISLFHEFFNKPMLRV